MAAGLWLRLLPVYGPAGGGNFLVCAADTGECLTGLCFVVDCRLLEEADA